MVCEHRQAAAFARARAADEAIGRASGARVFVAARHTFDLCEVRREGRRRGDERRCVESEE